MARVVAAVANGGKLHRPSLIRKIESSDGSFLDDSFAPEVVGELGIDASILQVIRDDMEGVVHDARGTARRAKMPEEWGIKVAGKTGTSQVVALDKHKKGTELDHHAWFVGYAPSDSPELVVSVIVENGGSGGLAAAPVVQETLKAYFMKTRGLKDPAAPATTSTEGASDAD
jgi:penicillin-binding protein 2